MKIGIDFDDTIVKTTEKVREYMDKYNVVNFKNYDHQMEFYKEHLVAITNELEFKENALECLCKLSENNELYLITARSNYYDDNLIPATKKFIKKHKLPFKELYFDCYGIEKALKCKELNIDIFIDDDINNCDATHAANIKTILIGKEDKPYKSIDNWNDILKEINKWMNV